MGKRVEGTAKYLEKKGERGSQKIINIYIYLYIYIYILRELLRVCDTLP